MTQQFVHLHTHSEYSVLDGHAKVSRLLDRAAELGQEALALTDHGVMFGAVEFYKQAVRGDEKTGRPPIKPIIGCEVYFTPHSRTKRDGKPELYHLLLLAENNTGYKNLMALVSQSWTTGFYYKPQVDLELLEEFSEGLIATSACMSGIVPKSIERGDDEAARTWAERYARIFGDGRFFLEIQQQGITADNGVTQSDINRALADLGRELGLPLVATNDIHYVQADEAKVQDILVCIQTGRTLDETDRLRFSSDQFYMKSAEQMAEALPEHPEALAMTAEIAERCNVEVEFGKIILPVFDVPGGRTEDEHLREECMKGLARRYGEPVPREALDRLESELAVITSKGLSAYFLIVADFVQWAKRNGIGVGPGRGSAAGSIISYALGITNLDPLAHGLIFERFLNPERTEMPDIDIDFDDERRGEVIDYVRKKYGEHRVAQVVTYSTMKARQAIRDAARVLGYPYAIGDRIAKLIPEGPDATIADALETNPDLREEYDAGGDVKAIIDAARALEGNVRGEGVHAAAVVICRDPLHEHAPVKLDTKGGAVITQYEGTVIAELGLLKMDFLGLRTLTVIAKCIQSIEENHGVKIDIDSIPLDDDATFEMLKRGDVDGVFQLGESSGMRQLVKDLQPESFAEIVACLALYRPGPLQSGMVRDFVNRKHGRAPVEYYDERIKHILEETYGTMVYQEQVMRISMEMAGFSAAKADKLRKAMGKKIPEEMAKWRSDFVEGSVANGYDRALAERVYDDIEKFAGYGFNKSHSAAYGLLAYQTAYLKAHYPLEFMAAQLTSYNGKTEQIVRYIAACNAAGIKVLPPDVNSSGKDFTATGGAIRFGLEGIRGVGGPVAEAIVAARKEGGPFTSLHDFLARVDARSLNKKTVEALIKAGAFDSTGYTRKQLMELMDHAMELAAKRQRDKESGQVSMFDLFEPQEHGLGEEAPPPDGVEWDKATKLAFEKEMLGIYVSDHPLSDKREIIEAARTHSLGQADELRDGVVGWFAGQVRDVERIATKAGKLMCAFVLEDLEGAVDALMFPQTYEKYRDVVAEDAIVRVRAKVEDSDRGRRLLVQEIHTLAEDGTFVRPPKTLHVRAPVSVLGNGGYDRFREILAHYPGRDAVVVELQYSDRIKRMRLGDESRVDASSPGLHAELKALLGADAVWEE
ncbi:DNA polymerase III, alpha subunit [Coriobacteriaceae bacterium EMTCatB1]|nr:DNA polymerase III, alpha subunit [Coriobacteriaceae bacterium EMTCatB1]